ncbi:uncharacterized protein F4822DRAFT_62773 [Hypoxylon trugodes]|uniref:uncharacterized protein n=1 Tax=Hypoxylon trugodes TaxID=326681 RepID=UPI0021960B7B|nr:uncharacterized protein F4822DRAFT_62773 [Hypoxylon trugodes]KAI1384155.1 hypothetical protein F4822DRAFT_62773 [Hypoxylon trugodes]
MVNVTYTISLEYRNHPNIVLRAGNVHGVCLGDIYAIYPWGNEDYSTYNPLPTAKVRVTDVRAMDSDVIFESGENEIEDISGCRAVLVKRDIPCPRVYIKLLPQTPEHLGNMVMERSKSVDGLAFLNTDTSAPKGGTLLYIATNGETQYRLLDSTQSEIPMVPLYDALQSSLIAAAHLGRYNFYLGLKNAVAPRYPFEFGRYSRETRQISNESIEVPYGTQITLGFKNESVVPLFLSVLYFDSIWGISKIFPKNKDFEEVDWKMYCDFDIVVGFPNECSNPNVVETLKAFVTTRPFSVQSLVTDNIDEQLQMDRAPSQIANKSEAMLPDTLARFDTPLSHSSRTTDLGRDTRPARLVNQVSTEDSWQTKNIPLNIIGPSKISGNE